MTKTKALAQPEQERNFCPRCGKRLGSNDWDIHTCTPPQPEHEPVNKYCCHLCFNKSGQLFLDRMILCPECGNKRCPKATHHELPCTNSNEPNQAGSVYTTPPQRTWVGLTDEEANECWDSLLGTSQFTREGITHAIEAKLRSKNT